MSEAWVIVLAVGAGTMLLKSAGPVLLGSRALPRPVEAVVATLAPALLAALVANSTFAVAQDLVIDARLAGVGAAAVAIALRAPIPVVVVVAAAVAAIVRAAGIG